MKTIEKALQSTDGIITTFTRNPEESWWELKIGIPKTWVYDENNKIGCEVIFENENGKLINVFPKKRDIVIDDLVAFVEIIIDTNEKIVEKEKQFTDKMQEMKGVLEKEAKKFYAELDELKKNSFKNLNETFAKGLDKSKTPRKPRVSRTQPQNNNIPSEAPSSVPLKKDTITEETETLDSSEK